MHVDKLLPAATIYEQNSPNQAFTFRVEIQTIQYIIKNRSIHIYCRVGWKLDLGMNQVVQCQTDRLIDDQTFIPIAPRLARHDAWLQLQRPMNLQNRNLQFLHKGACCNVEVKVKLLDGTAYYIGTIYSDILHIMFNISFIILQEMYAVWH